MQTSAAAAIIRRRRAMAPAAQRCLTRPRAALQLGRALSATGQARLLEQSELARWKLGFGNGFCERSGRPAVTFWACVRHLVHCSCVQRHPPHDFFFYLLTRRREGLGLFRTRPGCAGWGDKKIISLAWAADEARDSVSRRFLADAAERRRVLERLSGTKRVRNSGKGFLADVSSRVLRHT